MPIIDPSLQHFLIDNINNGKIKNNNDFGKDFLLRYLQVAAANIYKNLDTIQAYIQFKEDLKHSSSIIKEIYGGTYSFEYDINNPTINNFYSYLYDKIRQNYTKNMPLNQQGIYYFYQDIYQMRLFQPFICFPEYHSWYFTDSPIAILCINFDNFKECKDKEIYHFIKLEIDLMKASGFTLIICAKSYLHENDFFNVFLSNHQFAEIHLNLKHLDLFNDKQVLYELIEKNEITLSNNGYLYIYTNFFSYDKSNKKLKEIISDNLFLKIFFFSNDLSKSFKLGKIEIINGLSCVNKPFSYCKTGFDNEFIRVLLCNIPIFNRSDEETDSIPFSTSGIALTYIAKEDFLNCEDHRVQILFDDLVNTIKPIEKYANFDDIHLIRPDFYVVDTLYLAQIDKDTLNSVIDILENFSDEDEYKKENAFLLFKNQQIVKNLQNVIHHYQYSKIYYDKQYFSIHTNQIFTALDACKTCLYKKNKDEKGVIYQVETGEGKSCIIQLIAAVLSLSNKTVHIASSNINLSNRDYIDSINFFYRIKLESAVLLHYNELPEINIQDSSDSLSNELYPRKFFAKKLFNNSSSMNFSVCGIKNNGITDEKANIVFSTFINFESLYLKLMEMYPSNKFFNDTILLIDEADSILIDELTNGTILSRPMNTNGEEVLTFVYDCHEEKKDIKEVLNIIKQRWPKCTDICEDDIIEMYKEIDIIQQPEFTNGKKYSIEKIKGIKNKKNNSFKEIKEKIKRIPKEKYFFNKKYRRSYESSDEEDKNNDSNAETKKKHKKKIKEYKMIVPFDYEHKGILEPNKEFSGFIQQFIAIKEKKESSKKDKWIIKDVSMNYLYVSHPIFVNLYSCVC